MSNIVEILNTRIAELESQPKSEIVETKKKERD